MSLATNLVSHTVTLASVSVTEGHPSLSVHGTSLNITWKLVSRQNTTKHNKTQQNTTKRNNPQSTTRLVEATCKISAKAHIAGFQIAHKP